MTIMPTEEKDHRHNGFFAVEPRTQGWKANTYSAFSQNTGMDIHDDEGDALDIP